MVVTKQNPVTKNAMEQLNQVESPFAQHKKREALDKYNSMPMPREKEEDWRYTEIEKLKLENFQTDNQSSRILASKLSKDLIERGLVLTDINTALEKYPQARKFFFKNTKTDTDKFVAMNASHFAHGYFLHIPKSIELDEPLKVEIDFESNSVLHNIIVTETGSKIDFIEEYSNKEIEKERLIDCVTEVFANENSRINFCHLNNWTKNVYNFTNIVGTAERNSTINWISGCFGGKLNRLRIDTNFNGQGSHCENIGVFLARGKEHIDFTTNMYHNTLNTTNNVLVDGILKDASTSVYRGLIKIEKEAQKTSSYLANHILKLGDNTLANSIPSLKIEANDVKAGHGATVGQIDEEHMFYVMSRGLSREEAERLIIQGFFEPVIMRIPLEELREKVRIMVRQ